MNQPNFQCMNLKELRAYVLSHRDDQEAFSCYVDKLNAEGNWVEMSPSASVDDLINYPEFLQRFSNEKGCWEIKNNWEFTEVWIDPMLSPPYILLLLCDSEGNCQVYDPKQGDKVVFSSNNVSC